MQNYTARTDLAQEAHENLSEKLKEIDGVVCSEELIFNCRASCLEINLQSASDILCKPIGKYYTLYIDSFVSRSENSFSDTVHALSHILSRFNCINNSRRVLVACLGNPAVTPDAVGPCCADSIIVTRHLKESMPESFADFGNVSVLRTGVLGTTGIESADALKAICSVVQPDCVIAVDALAAGSLDRLGRNIQLCDSGIAPGSGVGNNRHSLNSSALGVPVVGIGIPTVVDASAFTDDEAAKGLFVTPRNIDELVKSVARVLAYGINMALNRGLSIEEIDALVE